MMKRCCKACEGRMSHIRKLDAIIIRKNEELRYLRRYLWRHKNAIQIEFNTSPKQSELEPTKPLDVSPEKICLPCLDNLHANCTHIKANAIMENVSKARTMLLTVMEAKAKAINLMDYEQAAIHRFRQDVLTAAIKVFEELAIEYQCGCLFTQCVLNYCPGARKQ